MMVIKWVEWNERMEKKDFSVDTGRLGGLHRIVWCPGGSGFLNPVKPMLNKQNFLLFWKYIHCTTIVWGILHPSKCSIKHLIGTMTKVCPFTWAWYSKCHGITGSSLLHPAPRPSTWCLSGFKSKFGKVIFLSGQFLVGYQTSLPQLIK